MRLIDADELILHLNDYALQEAPFERGNTEEVYHAIENCIEAIEEQPTAYDVDKVVEQLKLPKRNALVLCTANRGNLLEHIGMNTISNYENAIRIVKGGGVDE